MARTVKLTYPLRFDKIVHFCCDQLIRRVVAGFDLDNIIAAAFFVLTRNTDGAKGARKRLTVKFLSNVQPEAVSTEKLSDLVLYKPRNSEIPPPGH